MSGSQADHSLLENEYENSPIPLDKRKSLLSNSLVWIGFPMIITSAVTGATIVHGLGFTKGLTAIVIGNLLLFLYVGLLSMLGAKYGFNFAMLATRTFGKKGYAVSSILLSTLVVGWFAVQTGLTGVSMESAFGANPFTTALIAGVLYVLLTLVGIRALSLIGLISAPLFFVVGIYAAVEAAATGGSVWSYQGTGGGLTIGTSVTLVFALFADSGTMTADFTRWAKNQKHAAIATFTAFPLATAFAMIIGGIIAAASGGGGDVFGIIAEKGGALGVIAVLFLFVNLGSVCSHCLYNAAVGWSYVVGGRMRTLTLILGIIGTIIAVLGVWDYFINWLNLLGVIVPPIGAIIIMDQFVVRKNTSESYTLRLKPFAAWIIGSAAALIVNYQLPALSVAVVGIIVSAAAYLLISLNDLKSTANVMINTQSAKY
jgi:cytosine permease